MTDLIQRLRSYRAHDATADALMDEAARQLEDCLRLAAALQTEGEGLRKWLADATEELAELAAWQEDVCHIIQPAENADEWGLDVLNIIARREKQRNDARKLLHRVLEEQRITSALDARIRRFLAAREGRDDE